MRRTYSISFFVFLFFFPVSTSFVLAGGALPAIFQVSATKNVQFAPGNLQFTYVDSVWRFAEHQYDFVGNEYQGNVRVGDVKSTNTQVGFAGYTGWMDLFGWSTSATYYGVCAKTGSAAYSGDFIDWGTLKIQNGTGQDSSNTWFTLTSDEWKYLFSTRGSNKAGQAKVSDTYGWMFLPDDFVMPTGLNFSGGGIVGLNKYTADEWARMEAAGAVFLPVTGSRSGTYINNIASYSSSSYGYYWTGTTSSSTSSYANYLYFTGDASSVSYSNTTRPNGHAVRLVRHAQRWRVVASPDASTHGMVKGGGMVYDGEQITILAKESPCFRFIGWNDGITDNPRTVKVTRDTTIIAQYEEKDQCDSSKVLTGVFTVSPYRKVTFAPGNLQLRVRDSLWRFAENQYDYVGDTRVGTVLENEEKSTNTNIAKLGYSGWIDLYGWSTNTTYYGVSTSTAYWYSGDFVDWGSLRIQNGYKKDSPNTWSTLSNPEWYYLIYTRPNASLKYGYATITSQEDSVIHGVVFLPDSFTLPVGLTFVSSATKKWSANQFSAKDWTRMETAGAVFLPVTGGRSASMISAPDYGFYWTSSEYTPSPNYAYSLEFTYGQCFANQMRDRYSGKAVRLSKDAPYHMVTATADEVLHGEVVGGGRCYHNDTLLLLAKPTSCYRFLRWSDGCADNPRAVKVWQDTSFVAVFASQVSCDSSKRMVGVFSISDSTKVRFASGNLQYQPSSKTWRFAEHQYDVVGDNKEGNVYEQSVKCSNTNVGNASYDGWLDLFGWSTNAKYGVDKSTNNNYYYGAFNDWGHNVILNGNHLNTANTWFTLTKEEWLYVFTQRKKFKQKYGWATLYIDGDMYRGIVLLPDSFVQPPSLTFVNSSEKKEWTANWYNEGQWAAMESSGAVFFPVSGQRSGTSLSDITTSHGGHYWSATGNTSSPSYAYTFEFSDAGNSYSISQGQFRDRYSGMAVRLASSAMFRVWAEAQTPSDATISGAGYYYEQELVTLTANNSDCYVFKQWSDGCTTPTRTFNVIQDTIFYAQYDRKQDSVKVAVNDSLLGSVSLFTEDDFIDMGLSVLWAKTNLGAKEPSSMGLYFAWAETDGDEYQSSGVYARDFSWSRYVWCKGSYQTQRKYCTQVTYGQVDNITQIEPSDDAASCAFGAWCAIPTQAQMQELIDSCMWTWTMEDSKWGYKVTAKNGNSIFLPAAGWRTRTALNSLNSIGYYWTASLDTTLSYKAQYLNISSSGRTLESANRMLGYQIRPVMKKK